MHRGTIDPLPELPPSGLLAASEYLMTFMFGGCMEGSTAGCLFDVAATVFPFGKFGKLGKEVAEALEHADDAADIAKGARAAKKADEAAEQAHRSGVEYVTRPERLTHTFRPKHNFDPLVRLYGDQKAVIEAILRALADKVPEAGRFDIDIRLGGQTVVVRGVVMDGIIKIGTAFTP